VTIAQQQLAIFFLGSICCAGIANGVGVFYIVDVAFEIWNACFLKAFCMDL
jgi:hypothetical protein